MIVLRGLVALALGLLFGLGLIVSDMIQPAKVQGFLDVSGRWDASLSLVMGGALLVTLVAYPLILRRQRPLLAQHFDLPAARSIDASLLVGAALFGIGWGVSGFCPGPALVGVATGSRDALTFTAAMLAGMALHRLYLELRRPRQQP